MNSSSTHSHASLPNNRKLDELADEFVRRLRDGETPSVSEYSRQHPELADEIGELFPTLGMLEKFGADDQSAPGRSAVQGERPTQLGEYRIIREIGRGGMGIVYEAEHDTMRRRVALKVLPDRIKRPSYLQRFLREARAAGRLHHSNIVPVFEVGADDGIHYFAMQFIQGQNLDTIFEELRRLRNNEPLVRADADRDKTVEQSKADHSMAASLLTGTLKNTDLYEALEKSKPQADRDIAAGNLPAPESTTVSQETQALSSGSGLAAKGDRSSDTGKDRLSGAADSFFHRLARIGLQVADALHYAHQQGVLHRDIKPSNLILDSAGTVWVTDFGLAKHADEDLTNTGDIVGTLRYMAPERFSGTTDARGDIYALGLTLYELCTLRPAFVESDRAALIRRVIDDDPLPPRRIDSTIPRDLETIIQKAIAKLPTDRYRSCERMADDLRLFLADRPIQARPVPLHERLFRWCRRNQLQAASVILIGLLIVVIFLGALDLAYRSRTYARTLESENRQVMAAQRAAVQAEEEAVQAELMATRNLYQYCVGQARAGRWSGRPGQQFDSVSAINRAVSILDRMGFSDSKLREEKAALRSHAIVAFTLADVRLTKSWELQRNRLRAFDHDLQRYAENDPPGNLLVRRSADDELLAKLEGLGEITERPLFSNQGRFLAIVHRVNAQTRFRLWDFSSDEFLMDVDGTGVRHRCMFSDNDGLLVLGRADGTLELYDLPNGTIQNSIRLNHAAYRMAIAPDRSKLFASHHLDYFTAVNLETSATAEMEMPSKTMAITCNQNQVAVGCRDGLIHLFDSANLTSPAQILKEHTVPVIQLQFATSRNVLASQAWDSTVRLWNLKSGRQVLRCDACQALGNVVSSRGNSMAMIRERKTIGTYELADTSILREWYRTERPDPNEQLPPQIWNIALHPDNDSFAAFSTNEGVEFWDLSKQMMVGQLPIGIVRAVEFAPDGSYLLTSGGMGLVEWPLAKVSSNAYQVGAANSLFEGNLERFSVDDKHEMLVVDRGSRLAAISRLRNPKQRFNISHSNIDRVLLSPDGRFAATATWGGKGVKVWDAENGKQLRFLAPEISNATIRFSPDGSRLVAADGHELFCWRTETWELERKLPRGVGDGWPGLVEFSNDGSLLVAAHSRFILQLIDLQTGHSIARLEPPVLSGHAACRFSSDDRSLTVATGRAVLVWDLPKIRSRLAEIGLDWSDATIDVTERTVPNTPLVVTVCSE